MYICIDKIDASELLSNKLYNIAIYIYFNNKLSVSVLNCGQCQFVLPKEIKIHKDFNLQYKATVYLILLIVKFWINMEFIERHEILMK